MYINSGSLDELAANLIEAAANFCAGTSTFWVSIDFCPDAGIRIRAMTTPDDFSMLFFNYPKRIVERKDDLRYPQEVVTDVSGVEVFALLPGRDAAC